MSEHTVRNDAPTCNCIVVRDLVRERYVWMHGLFGDCGHPPTGTPVTERTRITPPAATEDVQ